MCSRKVVFNVTHYMDYHPGGWDELVRGAGRDATDMFNEIHRCIISSDRSSYSDGGLLYISKPTFSDFHSVP